MSPLLECKRRHNPLPGAGLVGTRSQGCQPAEKTQDSRTVTEIHVVENALALARLTRLRELDTGATEFRRVLRDLGKMLVYEAMRDAVVVPEEIVTPMSNAVGVRLEAPPLLIPVLRAGLGMLDGALDLLGDAPVALLGVIRNEVTLEPSRYASTIPDDLKGRDALILDPMLATGGTIRHACEMLRKRNGGTVNVLCVIASAAGIERMRDLGLADHIWVTAIDESLDEHGFIVPGLGDAGDRQFGAMP